MPTGLDAVEWAAQAAQRGAGEILLTSMDRDGTKAGFDVALTRAVARAVSIPVIASGGVGELEHFAEGVIDGEADAVLAAKRVPFRPIQHSPGEGIHGQPGHSRAARLLEAPFAGCRSSAPGVVATRLGLHAALAASAVCASRAGVREWRRWHSDERRCGVAHSAKRCLIGRCRRLLRGRKGFEMELKFDDRGLIPVVVQQYDTGEVLMVAWMNAESLRLTQETKTTWFWSRSRQELWNKGATSGNMQRVISIDADCDADTLLVKVDSPGPACHTGARSCFFNRIYDAPEGAPKEE